VPGVDTIYVGPADLSLTLGLPPGMDNADSKFVEALETIVAGCAAHDVKPGIHCSPELAGKRHDQGFRMLTVGYDFGPVTAALRSDLAASRSATS
jgi:4-hydroxy-2-oxoheptanedioate aldolase